MRLREKKMEVAMLCALYQVREKEGTGGRPLCESVDGVGARPRANGAGNSSASVQPRA